MNDIVLSYAAEVTASVSLLLPVAVFGDVAGIPVVFIGQEFSRHGDLDAVALGVGQALDLHVEIDRRHDAVAELLLDQSLPRRAVDHHQLVEAIDERIGRRHWHAGAAHRHLVEQRGLGRAQAEQLAHQQHRRIAADLLADMLPAPALLALDVENLFGESGAIHLWVSCSLDSILPTDPPGVIPAGRRPARGPGSMYPSFCSFRTPGYLGPGSRRCRGSPGMTTERTQALQNMLTTSGRCRGDGDAVPQSRRPPVPPRAGAGAPRARGAGRAAFPPRPGTCGCG